MEFKLVKEKKREDILFCLQRFEDTWLAGSSDHSIHPIRFSDESPLPSLLQGHQSYVTGLKSAAGRLWSVGYDRLLNEWDLEKGRLVSSRLAHRKWIRHITASPDETQLATVGDDMVARVWNAQIGRAHV